MAAWIIPLLLGQAGLSSCVGQTPQILSPVETTMTQTDAARPTLYGPWRSSQIGGGGYVQNVIFTSDPRVLYAYVDVGGVFRSDDGGRRWRMLHDGIRGNGSGVVSVRDLSVHPNDPNDVLIVAGSQWAPREGLFRSRDGGKTWNKMLDAWFYGNESFRWAGRNLARSPLDPNRVLALGGGEGAFVSSDGGATWKNVGAEVFKNAYVSDVKFARDGKTVYASAQPTKIWRDGSQVDFVGGFFRSDDAGATWRKIADEAPTEFVQDPKNAARWWGISTQSRVVFSDDGGQTWQNGAQGLPAGEKSGAVSENAFSALGTGPDFLVVGSNRGTFYRRDVGENEWRKLENPKITENYEGRPWGSRIQPGKWQHFGAATASVVVDPSDPNHWFFTDWYAIYQSPDAGKSWDLSMDGVEVTVLHTLKADPSDPARVHLGMADNGYMTSRDGAFSYQSPHLNSNTKSIAISPREPQRLIATGDAADGQWESKQIWLSADAGESWRKSPMQGLPADWRGNSVTVLPNDPQVAFLTVSGDVKPNGGGVYRSRDGGVSWQWAGQGLDGNVFSNNIFGVGQEIAAASSGQVVAISQSRSAIYLWSGKDWRRLEGQLAGKPNDIAAGTNANGESVFWVAVKNDGLYRVQNGAATRVWQGDVGRVGADGNRVAIGTNDGVLYSLDGGQKWGEVGGLPHRFYPIVAFAGERLLAGTTGNGAFWMPLSPRGAQPLRAKPVAPREVEFPQVAARSLAGDWKVVWTGRGKLEATPSASGVTVRSVGDAAQGSVAIELTPWSGKERFAGRVQAQGTFEEAVVALQIFDAAGKQIGWQTLADAKNATSPQSFEAEVAWPSGAERVMLVAVINGSGQMTISP